jgi:hypothetical protein
MEPCRYLFRPTPWILEWADQRRVEQASYLPIVDTSKEHRRATWQLEKRYARWKSQVVRTRPDVLSSQISTVSLVFATLPMALEGLTV